MNIVSRIILTAALAVSPAILMAQNDFPQPPQRPDDAPFEKMERPPMPPMPPMTIQERAQRMTDHMNELLNLTEKQYKKIYKLNLKDLKEMEADSLFLGRRGMGFGPGGPGGPGFGPGGPGGPGGRAQFERDMERAGREFNALTPQQMEQLKATREQARIKKDKKLRKILTEEQYGLWIKAEQERLLRMQQMRKERGRGHGRGFRPEN